MQWEWVVAVAAIAIWIITSLIRHSEDDSPRERRPVSPGGARPPGEGTPRPVPEVERFLEEIDRMRRRTAEEQRQGREPVRKRPDAAGVPPVRRQPAPARSRLPAVVLPESPPPKAERQSPVTLQAVAVEPAAPPVTPLVTPATGPRPQSRAAAQLLAMLAQPESVRTAILLQEVLGPPRCRRKR
jgi:hypothetical protein